MKRALISVSNKEKASDFASALCELGYEIVSTEGTYRELKAAGIPAVQVEDITGFEECLDGRVKTLHPAVHGGILAVRDNPNHMNHLDKLGINTIDIVAVNLYPFKETILKEGVSFSQAVENIDIGGPAMVRSAAKNHLFVTVITDPCDYGIVVNEIKEHGEVTKETKLMLSAKAFAHTASYDALIAEYMKEAAGISSFGDTLTLTYEKAGDMRYGENPHQKAAYYKELKPLRGGLTEALKLHGKELSFNNINDLNGAVALIKEFDKPAAVCVKHSVPCGAAVGNSVYEAYSKAYESDPFSIYGGIVALNREVAEDTAKKLNEIFLEIIIAPAYTEEAIKILTSKKNVRIMLLPDITQSPNVKYMDVKKVLGGILIQEVDNIVLDSGSLKCVTDKEPTDEEMKDLIFAFKVVKYVKSNAITICKDRRTIGIGGGQVSRVWALKQAVEHAGEFFGAHSTKGSVIASDAYFPFSDCVEEAYKAGVTAIIQPGGSVRDEDSIKKCNEYGIAMVFTGIRHFRH